MKNFLAKRHENFFFIDIPSRSFTSMKYKPVGYIPQTTSSRECSTLDEDNPSKISSEMLNLG
jgi:hypothetical protein